MTDPMARDMNVQWAVVLCCASPASVRSRIKTIAVSTIASDNPSYLAIAPGGNFLYAANEGSGSGFVSAYSFNKSTGQLTFLDKQSTGGGGPCYVSVDSKRKWAIAANYGGGSLAVMPINADGSIAPMTEFMQHTGQGTNPQRQAASAEFWTGETCRVSFEARATPYHPSQTESAAKRAGLVVRVSPQISPRLPA